MQQTKNWVIDWGDKMLNVVYLVLVMYSNDGVSTTLVPQANMAQCQINAKNYGEIKYKGIGGGLVRSKAYCIAGVMPK